MTANLFTTLAICAALQAAAPKKPAVQKESTTVSAGISKQQLALEAKLDEILAQGDQTKRARDLPAEVAAYEKAKELLHSETLLLSNKTAFFGNWRVRISTQKSPTMP